MLEGGASVGNHNLGLRCGADGLFLGDAALIERRGTEYRLRSQTDLERLLRCAYGGRITVDAIEDGLVRIAAALDRNRVWAAQREAANLPLTDLPNPIAALRLEIEDLRLAAERLRRALLRTGWDPDKYPRAGVPPNPGWFAPGGGVATQVAQAEEDERALEEMRDPTAPLRQAQWDAALATLRRIDPHNPQLSTLTSPNWVPSNQDIAGINAEIGRAAIRRVTDFIVRDGLPIGVPGRGRDIRIVEGGATAARRAFEYLSVGGKNVTPTAYAGTLIELPGSAGFLGLRESESGPAVDVNVPGIPYRTLHYP